MSTVERQKWVCEQCKGVIKMETFMLLLQTRKAVLTLGFMNLLLLLTLDLMNFK